MFVSTTLGYSYSLAQQKKLKMGHKNVVHRSSRWKRLGYHPIRKKKNEFDKYYIKAPDDWEVKKFIMKEMTNDFLERHLLIEPSSCDKSDIFEDLTE